VRVFDFATLAAFPCDRDSQNP